MQTTKNNQHQGWIIDLISLGVGLVALYSLWLGSHPLFLPDEGRYSLIAREMINSHDYITPRLNGIPFLDKPILFYWLQALSMHVFGVNEWALRTFPALFGMMGCLITYICGRYLFSRLTALLSSIILATSPLYFGCAHYANLDLEVAVFISSSLLLFLTGLQSQQQRRFYFLISAYVFASLAFLTKGLIGIVFPGLIIATWFTLSKRWSELRRMHLPLGIGIFLLIAAPWYILAQQANPDFFHFFFVNQHFSRFISATTFNNQSPSWFYLPVILAGFFPWTAFLIQSIASICKRSWLKPQAHANELFLILWIGIVFAFFSTPHSKLIGYILPLFPAIALCIGHYFASYWNQKFTVSNLLFIILCIAVASLLFIATQHAWSEIVVNIKSHAYLASTLLALGAIAAIFMLKEHSALPLFVLCALTSGTLLITILNRADDLNQTTAKPLITQLTSIQGPNDEVANYFKFYHDVPLFLGKRVTLVANWNDIHIPERDNWIRELWYGMGEKKTNDDLITEDTFWQRFSSNKRLFVFLNSNYLEQFKKRAPHYYMLGQFNDIILISNKI